MYKNIITIMLSFLPLIGIAQTPVDFLPGGIVLEPYGNLSQNLSSPPGQWKLMFSDEFDGTGTDLDANNIDLDKWQYKEHNDGVMAYRRENVKVTGGYLQIDIKQENYNGQHYTSGEIGSIDGQADDPYSNTKTRKLFERGMFEARVKFPKAYWAHSCFWVWQNEGVGEIDIAEHWNRFLSIGCQELSSETMGLFSHNHHGAYPFLIPYNETSKAHAHNFNSRTPSEDFHIYRVIWDKYFIYYYIDGIFIWKVPRLSIPIVMNNPNLDIPMFNSTTVPGMYRINDYIFSLNQGGTVKLGTGLDPKVWPSTDVYNMCTNNQNNAHNIANGAMSQWEGVPDKMIVDWVRVYQRSECETKEVITSSTLFPHEKLSTPYSFLATDDDWQTYKSIDLGTQFNESWTNGVTTTNWQNIVPAWGEGYYKATAITMYPNFESIARQYSHYNQKSHFTYDARECNSIENEYIVPEPFDPDDEFDGQHKEGFDCASLDTVLLDSIFNSEDTSLINQFTAFLDSVGCDRHGNKTGQNEARGVNRQSGNPTLDNIEKSSSIANVKIYPNPNNGSFTIALPIATECDVSVTNALGIEVYKSKIKKDLRTSIRLDNVSSGTYTIKISGHNINHVEKLTIIK